MKNHKLFLLIAQLSTLERRDLAKYLQSPYFNNRKLAHQLYQFLQKNRQVPDKISLFQHLFPNEKYKDEKLRLVMSQLVKKIEGFLIYQEQQKFKIEQSKILAQVYQQKNRPKVAEKVLTRTIADHEKQPIRNGQYYFTQYEMKLKRFDYATSVRTTEQNLQEVSDNLDTAFLILKLQQACSSLSHQAVYQQEYRLGLLNLILPYIQEHQLTKIPAVGIYYYCYLALSGQSAKENFLQFKQLLFSYQDHFPKKEWSNLFLFGINICIRIINDGDRTYLKEILELYKRGLETEALLENGILTRFTYQNIVTAGMRTGELDWTRQFIIDFKEKVEKVYREGAYRFNMARIAYHQRNLHEALDLLQDAEQQDLLITLYSKTLLIKIYYELEEFKLLDSFLDAFQIYLRRKKVIAFHKENHRNMIYYTQKLIKVNPFNAEAKTKLKTRIQNEPALVEKEWLLTQLAKMI